MADQPIPEALIEFMSTDWAPSEPVIEGPSPAASYHAVRRSRLSSMFPGDWIVVPTGNLKVRANDTDYRFRPGTDFAWLTGSHEPDNVLVMAPVSGGHQATLYVAPRSDRSTSAFFSDRRYGELWVGPRLGLSQTATLFGIDTAPLGELAAVLKEADAGRARVVRGFDTMVDSAIAGPSDSASSDSASSDSATSDSASSDSASSDSASSDSASGAESDSADLDCELLEALAALRLVKDVHEVACLQAAVDATILGFADVVRALPGATDTSERWVEGTFNRRARTEGNDVGYDTIAACGHHACTLHWTRNDGPVRPGELLLLDAGVEGPELYTADVTRTIPISGTYTSAQREIHDLVWRAQQAGFAQCRPGQPFLGPHHAAVRVMTSWLVEKGILRCTVEEALDPEHKFHTRYTLHGVSHMLGLDVHDCANARNGYRGDDLVEGMVLTVEPGLYFQPDDLTVPEQYRGIGVRIEDDVLITADGCRVLSAALPSRADETEAWMAGLLRSR